VLLEGGAIGQVRRWQVLRTVAGYPTRREAQALLDERLRAVNAGASPPEASIAFRTFVEEQWKALVLPTFKASTPHGYKTTLRAAHKLAEAVIESSTLQRHLSRGDEQARPSDQKRLYVLDESSLASTKQIHTFLERLSLEHCVLLRGDVRQHEAVDAGRPYHQLQEAGIRTAHLDEIVRQRDAELRAVVEELSRGNVQNAVEGLDRQGRVHEIARREERLAAIANEYVKEPHATLVISPDNQSRQDPNDVIHRAMQHEGHVARDEHEMSVLVPGQEITGADRQWAARYEVDDLVR
jgi:AAA domain